MIWKREETPSPSSFPLTDHNRHESSLETPLRIEVGNVQRWQSSGEDTGTSFEEAVGG